MQRYSWEHAEEVNNILTRDWRLLQGRDTPYIVSYMQFSTKLIEKCAILVTGTIAKVM